MSSSTQFPNEAASVFGARRLVVASLAGYGGDMVETARLLTSELATNAVVHAASGFGLAISDVEGTIRIEVTDRNAELPVIRPIDQDASHGRGLHMVDRLAALWGVEASADGKTVWFELRCGDFD